MKKVTAWVVVLMVLGGCSSQEDDMNLQERAEARAAEARAFIDDLAGRLGHEPQVRQNTLTDCVPGQDDSGLDLLYTVRVAIDPGTADRLRGEVSEALAADGWTVKSDPTGANGVISVRFQRDTFTMGAKISEADGVATIGGSGGCVQ